MAEHLEYLVMDGEVVRYDQAVLHISTPAVRYGATAFEGVRAYWNDEEGELYLFRAREHAARLLQSARLMGMAPIEYRVEDVVALMIDLLRANDVRQGVHLRPSLFVAGDGSIQGAGPGLAGDRSRAGRGRRRQPTAGTADPSASRCRRGGGSRTTRLLRG